jgi:hypothetical protein
MPQDEHVRAPEFRTCRNGQGRRCVGSLIAGLDESVKKASGCSAAARRRAEKSRGPRSRMTLRYRRSCCQVRVGQPSVRPSQRQLV